MNRLVIPLVLCVTNISNAFVYRMELWEDDKKTAVITFSDWHVDTLSITTTIQQKKEILALAKQLNAYAIFEDIGWYTGNNPEILKALKWTRNLAYYGQKVGWLIPSWVENKVNIQQASPLFDITIDAKKQGIACESIEFRYATLWAKNGYPIPLYHVYQELVDKAQEIQKYNDDEIMKKIYDFLLSLHVKYNQETLDLLKKASEEKSNTITALPKHEHYRLESVGHVLLDIDILHALYTQIKAGKKIFIIYTGGDHIEGIHYGLDAMGFKEKASIGDKITYGISDKQLRERLKNALNIPQAYEQLQKQSHQKVSEEVKARG